ncbi:hypothetical protein [Alicyclobacillus dauci]|uniref:Phage Mu protein F like protein n=1 Tax=Alicyclobacillus dauci TaxID=1475485 RepID=A0ABY6YY87_9BACL|nr:hypothetical protein [Alicyclobacillus dauci]WAH35039.1 hypothetical protein NZD86_11940 [Alicyclobacillus dauci]
MKWYEKVLYRIGTAIIPANIKRMMMGSGRMTVPKNANPWNIFNWLPKKYQTAHNIDLTKLQNYTAEELLELLVSVHPDVSHALHTYLRMGETEMTFTADNEGAQTTIDALVDMMNTPLPSPGYQVGRELAKLDGVQRMMVMVRGACAGEVVLNEQCNDVVDIVPVDPMLIWFRRRPDDQRLEPWQYVRFPKYDQADQGGEWFGQYKKIDTPTFIYEELDPMVDDPYGRSPILPVLQIVFFHLQVLQDIKAVVHNQGYPRMDVKILEEVILKNMPAQFKADPNAQRNWLSGKLTEYQNLFSSLNPDDAMIHWDSVEVKYVEGMRGPAIDIEKLIDVIDTQLATALKTLLTMLSRHQGSTETYSSVDTQIYIKTVESARNVTKRFWSRAFSMAARVKGVQTRVDVDYAPIDLRSENEQQGDLKARIENVESADSNFYITPEEAAIEIRKALGLDADIPPELVEKLKNKHEQPETPTQENPSVPPTPPPSANSRMRLDSSGDNQDSQDNQNEEQFIALYLALMRHVRDEAKHAMSLEGIKASMSIRDGIQHQLSRGLYQLYRNTYVDSYNARARAKGTSLIRNPDAQTSLELQLQANQIAKDTTDTYMRELNNAWNEAVDFTSELEAEEQLSRVRQMMQQWADERMDYKSSQIAQHEAADAYHQGMFAHDTVHAPDTTYGVEPTTTEHEACADIIAGAPYTLDRAQTLTLPLHPNCPHRFVPID